ncbi:MAG: response regulator [SAR324 cluster bacterium]|nr:response regulator [SAR324 cluster bacterium]
MKIMIVDDSVVARESLRALLGSYGTCDVFSDALEAIQGFHLAHAKGQPYQLMTLDIDMPGMNGKQLMSYIRKWENYSNLTDQKIRIIMITMITNYHKKEADSSKHGCEDCIVKPATREKIAAVLGHTAEYYKNHPQGHHES